MEAARTIEALEDVQYPVQRARMVARWHDGSVLQAIDQVIEEVPVAMVYNGISHAVMLASPTSLKPFGLGFSLSEGIVRDRSELYDLEVVPDCHGIALQMTISAERFAGLKERRRSLAGRTGCGLCGTESLEQVQRHPKVTTQNLKISRVVLQKALDALPSMQLLQASTGAVHAAAWANREGDLMWVEEDIGRHNALDKLVGKLALEGIAPQEGFALVTSRASYEMAQKAATAGIELLAAVSAPTGLAIDLAEEAGLTLIGFARQRSHVVYTHPHRLD
jgi:FdhD protein